MTPEARPLWREVLGDAEPHRRGREAIIVVSVLILLGEAVKVVATMMGGDVPVFFLRVVIAWLVSAPALFRLDRPNLGRAGSWHRCFALTDVGI
jgi:hypothetical protein